MNQYALFFEELEAQEELTAWWQYALVGAGAVVCGVVVYVIVGGTAVAT